MSRLGRQKGRMRILSVILCGIMLTGLIAPSISYAAKEAADKPANETNIHTVEGCLGEDCAIANCECTCHPSAEEETQALSASQPMRAANQNAANEAAVHISGCNDNCTNQFCSCNCHVPKYDKFIVQSDEHSGTTVNLFDYWLTEDRFDADNTGFENPASAKDKRETGINKYQLLEFSKGTNNNGTGKPGVGKYRQMTQYVGAGNAPYQGILESKLDANGYPRLKQSHYEEYASTGNYLGKQEYLNQYGLQAGVNPEKTLAYLFDPNYNTNSELSKYRKAYSNVKGLFQLDNDGYYYYDSKQNFASFDEDGKKFKLYDYAYPWGALGQSDIDKDRYDKADNPGGGGVVAGGSSPNGQFFPFNTAPQVFKIRNDANTENKDVLQRKKVLSTDSVINHYFGMSMQTSFVQQKIVNGKDMSYHFSGDDDIWIFIDGVLVADLGGNHDATAVDINFADGTVKIYNTAKGSSNGGFDKIPDTTLKGIFREVQGTDFNEAAFDGDTFADNTSHTLDVFYLERGNTDSNLELKFNLVDLPSSNIVKNDQDGKPIVGAEFELWTATYDETSKASTPEEKICTVTTGTDGEAVLIDKDGKLLVWGDIVAKYETTEFVLKETKTPIGYRPLNEDLAFYYEDGVVLTRNTFETGAWTDAVLSVVMLTDDKLLSGTAQEVTIDGETKTLKEGDNLTDAFGADFFNDGVMFAVPMRFTGDTNVTLTDEQLKQKGAYSQLPFFNETNFHPMYGSVAEGWHVMAESITNKGATMEAAKSFNTVAGRNVQGQFSFEMNNLAGSIRERNAFVLAEAREKYPTEGFGQDSTEYIEAFNQQMVYMNQHCKYLMAYYFAPGVADIQNVDENTPLIRIHSANHTRSYAAELHIPNMFDTFAVQKLDYYGNRLENATFGLIQLFSEKQRDGYKQITYKDCTPVTDTSGHNLWYNPKLLNNTEDDPPYLDKESGKPVYKLKSYSEIMQMISAKQIKLWDSVTTGKPDFSRENLGLEGVGFFPSKKGSATDAEDTSTYLEVGYYLLLETGAPAGYGINDEMTYVRIEHDGIIADAGKINDGIRVGKSVGHPLNSMLYFCSEDPMDATLTYVDGVLESSDIGAVGADGQLGFDYHTPAEGVTKYLYKFHSHDKYYHRYADDVGDYISQGRNMFLYSDVGYIHMNVTQNQSGVPYTMSLHGQHPHDDTITVKIGNKKTGEVEATYSIPAHQGQLVLRMKDDQKLLSAVSDKHQKLEDMTNKPGGATAENHFVLFKPNYTELPQDMDLSHLFVTTTVVQVQDQTLGNLKIEKNVYYDKGQQGSGTPNNPPQGTDVKPFYYLMVGEFERATKIVLRDGNGDQSNYTGVLNVRVIKTDNLSDPNTQPSLESTGTTVPKYFENGECLFYLPDGYYVDRVNIPEGITENNPHEGETVKDKNGQDVQTKLKAVGDKQPYARVRVNISLADGSSGLKKVTTVNPNNESDTMVVPDLTDPNAPAVWFVDGGATIERDPGHSIIRINGYTQVDEFDETSAEKKEFTATSRVHNAPVEAVYGSNMTNKIPVQFSYAQGIDEQQQYAPVTSSGLTGGNTDTVSTNTSISHDPTLGHTISFAGDMQAAIFALYPGQSITMSGLCGMRYQIIEIGEGGWDKALVQQNTTDGFANIDTSLSKLPKMAELRSKWFIDGMVKADSDGNLENNENSELDFFNSDIGLASGLIRPGKYTTPEGTDVTDITQYVTFNNKKNDIALRIEKEVTGNMGDRNKYFAVDVEIVVNTINHPAEEFRVIGGSKMGNGVNSQAEVFISPTNKTDTQWTFKDTLWLKHGETLSVLNVPVDATYSVKEVTRGTASGQTIDMGGHELKGYIVTGSNDEQLTNTVAGGVQGKIQESETMVTVKIENNKVGTIDTGIGRGSMICIALLALIITGSAIYMIIRRLRQYS